MNSLSFPSLIAAAATAAAALVNKIWPLSRSSSGSTNQFNAFSIMLSFNRPPSQSFFLSLPFFLLISLFLSYLATTAGAKKAHSSSYLTFSGILTLSLFLSWYSFSLFIFNFSFYLSIIISLSFSSILSLSSQYSQTLQFLFIFLLH